VTYAYDQTVGEEAIKSNQTGVGVLTPSIAEKTLVSSNETGILVPSDNNGTKVPAPKGCKIHQMHPWGNISNAPLG